jgi:hypothetical protein
MVQCGMSGEQNCIYRILMFFVAIYLGNTRPENGAKIWSYSFFGTDLPKYSFPLIHFTQHTSLLHAHSLREEKYSYGMQHDTCSSREHRSSMLNIKARDANIKGTQFRLLHTIVWQRFNDPWRRQRVTQEPLSSIMKR